MYEVIETDSKNTKKNFICTIKRFNNLYTEL